MNELKVTREQFVFSTRLHLVVCVLDNDIEPPKNVGQLIDFLSQAASLFQELTGVDRSAISMNAVQDPIYSKKMCVFYASANECPEGIQETSDPNITVQLQMLTGS